MASYNHAPFIRTTVESVLAQTFPAWELVITDDGSSDGTIEALDGIADERILIERFPENRSACVAINHCIRRARGAFIAILNSDDAWHPTKLAQQLAVLAAQPQTAAVFTRADIIDERGRPLTIDHPVRQIFNQENRDRQAWLRRLFYQGNCLCHPSVLVRADVYREVGLYDECLAQLPDLDMWCRICFRHDIWVIQEPLTLFRVLDRERNASGNRPDSRLRCANENLLIAWKAFREHPDEMANLLRSPAAAANHAAGGHATDELHELLDLGRTNRLPVGMEAAELLWMHGCLAGSGDWSACQKFIAKTGVSDAFTLRVIEALQSRPAAPANRWRRAWSALWCHARS